MAAAAAYVAFRADGLVHLVAAGQDLPRGPLGVLAYLPLALAWWAVPRQYRRAYLIGSSLLLALVTVGPAYMITVALLSMVGLALVHAVGQREGALVEAEPIAAEAGIEAAGSGGPSPLAEQRTSPKRKRGRDRSEGPSLALRAGRSIDFRAELSGPVSGVPRGTLLAALLVLWLMYLLLLVRPQPGWLPAVHQPLYFYLQWAGIGYIFLKTVHVLVDVSTGRIAPPPGADFLAYILFAPTLRMGPIYRYGDFADQLQRKPGPHRDFGAAVIRLAAGFVRLGLMLALLSRFPIERLCDAPEALSAGSVIAGIYAAPISIYLWISGYVDFSVGVGLIMGFGVPENFNWPWRSTSLADFWRRWHITLGAWLRDYIYIPLGGNRRHVFLNYLAAFLFCGIWHGLYLSYALWGISQGVGLAVGRSWRLLWDGQREAGSPVYRKLARWRLVNSRFNTAVAWVLTFNYQILTITWFMDERHTGRLVAHRLIETIAG